MDVRFWEDEPHDNRQHETGNSSSPREETQKVKGVRIVIATARITR